MKKVLDWVRSLSWHGGVDPLIFLGTVISLWSAVSGARASGTCECDKECPKTRELVTTVWGGAFTLFVLSLDTWGMVKYFFEQKSSILVKIIELFAVFIWLVLNPILMLTQVVGDAVRSYHMMWRMPGFTVWSSLLPWTKNPAKIVSGCQVVITIPAMISISDGFIDGTPPCLSEALVIGHAQEESRDMTDHRLGYNGKAVLLGLDVLPPYDQLKVLQGNSGLATIISAVQSMGYIYGVVVRTAQGLPVSPIEVVAVTLSIVILTKALIHNISSTCHRPLHVYLTHDKALTFAGMCKECKISTIPISQIAGPMVVIVLLVSGVLIYYIIHVWQATRIMIFLPMLFTLVGLYFPLLLCVVDFGCIMTICGMINATAYGLALVVTIKYWEVDRLNAKTSSMLAQIFPYIG